MIVKTYEINCNEENREAEEEERKLLIEKLELKIDEKPIYFPEITPSEMRVWEAILPYKTELTKYQGFIPTAVLRIYDKYGLEFDNVEIWSNRDNDPLLVGKRLIQTFMLARWGMEIDPIEIIRERAKKFWIAKRKAKLDALSITIESDCESYFNSEYVNYIE